MGNAVLKILLRVEGVEKFKFKVYELNQPEYEFLQALSDDEFDGFDTRNGYYYYGKHTVETKCLMTVPNELSDESIVGLDSI